MKVFPLVRLKLSNEHIMTAVFIVLILFQLPYWVENPLRIINFAGVLFIGLLVDSILSMIRNKAIKCTVSAAVTVGIIFVLVPTLSFLWGIVSVTIALVIGKHVFGGTGRNVFNPAMVGVIVLGLVAPTGDTLFAFNYVVGAAMLFSIPFMVIRPYAAMGFITGTMVMMGLNGTLSFQSVISSGVLFYAGMVITDPVTITRRPLIGALGGFVASSIAMAYDGALSLNTVALVVLGFNLISAMNERQAKSIGGIQTKNTIIKEPYRNIITNSNHLSLPENQEAEREDQKNFGTEDILNRIKENDVLGLGGGGFSSYEKIKSVINANEKEKILIINAVECDPGLVHDHWVLRQFTNEIYKGIEFLRLCLPSVRVIIATKDIKDIRDFGDIEIQKVPNYYPIGAEKKLIEYLLGYKLQSEVRPTDHGILVLNVQTMYAIYEAVALNKKAVTKFITIANLLKEEARVIKVVLGSKVSEIIESVYGNTEAVFVGGGIMQARPILENELIGQSTNYIATGNFPRYKESYCSSCGICVQKCPSRIEVYKIAHYVDNNELEKTIKYRPDQCISCGICSYYCLAGKNLSRKVKRAKNFQMDNPSTV